jgi:hypothetical protein
MKTILGTIFVVILAGSSTVRAGQERAANPPSARDKGAATKVSPGQAAMDRAAAAKKYVFLFFWKENGEQTDKAWSVFKPAAAKLAKSADVVPIQIADTAEKPIVEKYGVDRAPMPLVLAIAPCGAITNSFTKSFDEKQLRTAFVSPCKQLCLKALQSRKLVFVCVEEKSDPKAPLTAPAGVRDFKADKKFGPATEIVLVDAHDQSEATFLKELNLEPPLLMNPTTVFLAPPGVSLGIYVGPFSKQALIDDLAAELSSPCGGGKCGPGGCGPKK